ncbi:P-loop containing nucleoside triphosphate hydrolase protein [Lasiosphaeris hirsuta]|uniref:P-loop containing nucleoside triphosphate hydrolase protein n=1 Tax=Lasiosphaeris hirsuta TaxID=260670 RepID=A0AA40DYX4_9PEZI|nr:P-loop containing nucleoside triphosphate hydrolase protein [Lasiosphaeris hirsuta]
MGLIYCSANCLSAFIESRMFLGVFGSPHYAFLVPSFRLPPWFSSFKYQVPMSLSVSACLTRPKTPIDISFFPSLLPHKLVFRPEGSILLTPLRQPSFLLSHPSSTSPVKMADGDQSQGRNAVQPLIPVPDKTVVETRPAQDPRSQPSGNTRTLKILVVGVTGSGKSSFISAVLGEDIGIGHSADPCTRDCKLYSVLYKDVVFELIDTPGFDDPTRDGIDILRNITLHVEGVAGVIYCHRMTDTRLNGDDKLNLEVVKAMCGERFFSRIVICSTHWDTTMPGSREAPQARMESLLDKEFESIMEGGAMYMEFLGESKPASSLNVLDLFLTQRRPPMMALLDQRLRVRTARETHAGKVIEEDYRKRQKGKLAQRQLHADVPKDIHGEAKGSKLVQEIKGLGKAFLGVATNNTPRT